MRQKTSNTLDKGRGPPRSNHKAKALYDQESERRIQEPGDDRNNNSVSPALIRNAENTSRVFRRGMREVAVKRELFMLEGEDRFEERSLRSKMTEVMKRSSEELKERFYELGVTNSLPVSWDKFKIWFQECCTESSLLSFKKYNNEGWLEYCCRLRDMGKLKNLPENDILKKLRSEYLPRRLQVILFSVGISLETAIERFEELEKANFMNNKNKQIKNKKIEVNQAEKGTRYNIDALIVISSDIRKGTV